MGERIKRGDDESLYQPKLHSRRIRALHQVAVNERKPMTVILDNFVMRGVREYNGNMEEKPFESVMEELAGSVSYFNLQKVDGGWFLSFVDSEGEVIEYEGENLKALMHQATNPVSASSEDQTSTPESSAPPSPRSR